MSKYRIVINIRRFSVSVASSRQNRNQCPTEIQGSRPVSSVLVRPANQDKKLNRPWSAKSISTVAPSSAIQSRPSRPNSAKRVHNGKYKLLNN